MPSLKDLRNRISSVKSTQKITSAMKMVAASKLKRAQEQAEAGRPYAERMNRMLVGLSSSLGPGGQGPKLMTGTGSTQTHLLVPITSDRGLCGGFNSSIVRETRRRIQALQAEGKTVKLFCVGRKGRDVLRREYSSLIVESMTDIGRPRLSFADANEIRDKLLARYEAGEFDVCSVIFNRFVSAISQKVEIPQLIPVQMPETGSAATAGDGGKQAADDPRKRAPYEFEPSEEEILAELLPRNLAVQIFRALLESAASEQGARMTAMDSATRNAGDMINDLTLQYNRTRQAMITKELIEIISGAEAL
ncbi:MAG: F0F1 ATP synthase subunit gamma [Alphaproteobacteria bacterium]|jgi:F-type H+-transporting ATPase subunit gamma|nr:F0F1 ATP synthase subunit gamma [Alphaproteobacteria bacterium]